MEQKLSERILGNKRLDGEDLATYHARLKSEKIMIKNYRKNGKLIWDSRRGQAIRKDK